MIDWQEIAVTEPPILRNIEITNENITALSSQKITDTDFDVDVYDLPCHTQAVERTVKLVTEASKAVVGQENRHGFILNTLKSRKEMPFSGPKEIIMLQIKKKQIKNSVVIIVARDVL